MAQLTATRVKAIKPHEKVKRYSAGDGLHLVVQPSGAKSWVIRQQVGGRRRDKGLGGYPAVSLAVARRKAENYRVDLAEGRDPVRSRAAPTFRKMMDEYIKVNAPTWRNPKTAANKRSRLEQYADALFDRRVDRITRGDVLAVLLPIWTDIPSAARKLRQDLRGVFSLAVAHEWRDTNPAGDEISAVLPKTPAVKNHFRSLPYPELTDALRVIDNGPSCDSVKRCLQFLVLTAARSGEARGASWEEIDMDAGIWTVPASRMKAGKPHQVPLSDAAMQVLSECGPKAKGLVFPSPHKRGELSDMTLTKCLRDNGLADRATVHGFRSTFRTWAMEQTDVSWAVGEAALAHSLGNSVEQAYARSTLFEKRRAFMQGWADYVAT